MDKQNILSECRQGKTIHAGFLPTNKKHYVNTGTENSCKDIHGGTLPCFSHPNCVRFATLKQCPLSGLLHRPKAITLRAWPQSALYGEKYPLTLQDRE